MSEEFDDFGLPDINTVSKFDENYVSFLEQSVSEIEDMAMQHNADADEILSETSEIERAIYSQSEAAKAIQERGKAIQKTARQFTDALKELVFVETLHEPETDYVFARAFFEGSDGTLYETRLDLHKVESLDIYTCHSLNAELLRDPDFLAKNRDIFRGEAIYLASPMSDKLSLGSLFRFAMLKIQDDFDAKHPEIVEKYFSNEETPAVPEYDISNRISSCFSNRMPDPIIPPDVSHN